MIPKISLVTAIAGAALALTAPAWGDPWGADHVTAAVRISPDLADHAIAARHDHLASTLDARERSFSAGRDAQPGPGTPDPARDDHFRLNPSSIPTLAATTGTARNIEWPQIGIGFAVGVMLVVGLLLATRSIRLRQPAH
jgi:hypothetical protein